MEAFGRRGDAVMVVVVVVVVVVRIYKMKHWNMFPTKCTRNMGFRHRRNSWVWGIDKIVKGLLIKQIINISKTENDTKAE